MTEIHGHRGCRGLMPQNTVQGFLKAIDLGATAIEMDLVVSADKQLVVSHEPWMHHLICLGQKRQPIPRNEEQNHNIYRMDYAQVKQYDCGSLRHPDFPDQKTEPAHKPLLSEVIESVESKIRNTPKEHLRYNLEVKSSAETDSVFHPAPNEFANLIIAQIRNFNLPADRFLLQSFDARILHEFNRLQTGIELGLLVENADPVACLAKLDFRPDYLNPHYSLAGKQLMNFCLQHRLKVLPWTVNEKPEMHRLLDLNVSGLITDYPDRAAEVVKERLG